MQWCGDFQATADQGSTNDRMKGTAVPFFSARQEVNAANYVKKFREAARGGQTQPMTLWSAPRCV